MHPISAALLDIDGTLIDSNDAHALAWQTVLEKFGHRVAFERVRRHIGQGGDELLAALAGIDEESPIGKEIEEARRPILRDLLASVRPFEGARALLEALRARGTRLVLATSAGADELRALLRIAQIEHLLADVTTSDDAAHSKPSPDIVQAAAAKAGCRPGECAMIGDTPYDVIAARRAGTHVIAFRCGGWDDESLAGADEIYDGPLDLLGKLDASMLGRPPHD
jgi:HAD superfamily hydrolase (TIGR01509 family)